MARIVVLLHESSSEDLLGYSIGQFAQVWRSQGHHVVAAKGCSALADADLVFVHVDLSLVPSEYLDAASGYPASINGSAKDIRKQAVSRNLLARGADWQGAVIVKTNLNYGGWPEWRSAKYAFEQTGENVRFAKPLADYPVYANVAAVPDSVWDEPGFVVERFLPEQEDDRFYVRTWFFCGDQEGTRRFVSKMPVVKGVRMQDDGPCEVPDAIRAERERLRLDYGKMDFVIHKGEPVLLDANKTPGGAPAARDSLAFYERLGRGIGPFLAAAAMAR